MGSTVTKPRRKAARTGSDAASDKLLRLLGMLPKTGLQDLAKLARSKEFQSLAGVKDADKLVRAYRTESFEQLLVSNAARDFPGFFPIQIHERGPGSVSRRSAAEQLDNSKDDFPIRDWDESPKAWWMVAASALKAGLRVSIAVPRHWATDVAAIAGQRITEPLRASYDVYAGRLVLIHRDEDDIHNRQADEET